MEIKFFCGRDLYSPGDFCGALIGEGFGQIVLCEGSKEEKEGTQIEIFASSYVINNKRYPLQGDTIKAVLTEDNRLVPLLRKAKGLEITAIQKVIPGSLHVPSERIGPKTEYWPIINRQKTNKVETKGIEIFEDIFRYASIISKNKEGKVQENTIEETEEIIEETES